LSAKYYTLLGKLSPFRTLASYCALSFIALLLLYVYREGGPKDDGIYKNAGLRDAGVYLEVGRYILQGDNPYIPPMSRWGTFGPVPFTLFFDIFPESILTLVFQVANLAGIYVFFNILLRNRNIPRWKVNLGATLIFLCSPVREMLSTNQIIGITLGVLSIGIWAYKLAIEPTRKPLHQNVILTLSGFAFATIIDLKPHLYLVAFISITLIWKTWKLPVIVLLVLLVSHAIIDLSQMRILELDWLNTLLNLRDSAASNNLGDTLAIWPLLSYWYEGFNFSAQAGFVIPLVLGISAMVFAIKERIYFALVLCLLAPSVSFYSHYYDLIPILILAVTVFLNSGSSFTPIFVITFCVLPLQTDSLRNLIMLGSAVIICMLILKLRRTQIVVALVGFVVSSIIRWTIFLPEYTDRLVQSTIVTGTIFMLAFGLFTNKSHKEYQKTILQ
jgi:hypothetical protein